MGFESKVQPLNNFYATDQIQNESDVKKFVCLKLTFFIFENFELFLLQTMLIMFLKLM